jgi:hypothetical protein
MLKRELNFLVILVLILGMLAACEKIADIQCHQRIGRRVK